jgi:hypothetical protein
MPVLRFAGQENPGNASFLKKWRLKMRKLYSIFIVVLMVILPAVSAHALPSQPPYFAQDDFWLNYPNNPGNPGAAGATFTVEGYVKDWSNNSNLARFVMTGSNSAAATSDSSGHYVTKYDTGTSLKIYNLAKTSLYWESSSGFLETIVNASANPYEPTTWTASFPRPSYVDAPGQYSSVGNGWFVGSAVNSQSVLDLSFNEIYIPWFGTYNWGYDNVNPTLSTQQTGNIQGMLTVVEPGSLLLLGFGLVGLAAFARRRE